MKRKVPNNENRRVFSLNYIMIERPFNHSLHRHVRNGTAYTRKYMGKMFALFAYVKPVYDEGIFLLM